MLINKLIVLKDKLVAHTGFVKYFKNTSWLIGEKMLRLSMKLIVGVWVARYLGPEQYGLLSFATAFVGLFTVFTTLGLDSIIVRNIVKEEKKKDFLLGTGFWLKLFGAMAILIILAFAVGLSSYDGLTKILIYILATATIFTSFNVIDFYFQSKVKSKYVVYAKIISLGISSILKVILILNDASLVAFAIVVLLDSLLLAAGLVYYYKITKHKISEWVFRKDIAISLLKDSWPLIVSGLVISIYLRIDQVMIMEMIGSAAVGQYAPAVRLSQIWYFIPMLISSSLFPAIIRAKEKDEVFYNKSLQSLFDAMIWIAIIIALPITLLSSWIIYILYGSEYYQSADVLEIQVWAGVFVAFGVARGKWLLAENLQKYSIYFIGLGGIANVVLNLTLIPIYGIIGAAYATLISQSISAYFAPLLFKPTRPSCIMFNKSLFPFHLLRRGGINIPKR